MSPPTLSRLQPTREQPQQPQHPVRWTFSSGRLKIVFFYLFSFLSFLLFLLFVFLFFEMFFFLFFSIILLFHFLSFLVGVEQHHPTEDKGEVAPPGSPPKEGGGKAAPPHGRGRERSPTQGGGEGRQQHAKGEGNTQPHFKEEAEQHHATGTAPPKGGRKGSTLQNREGEKATPPKQHHPTKKKEK